MWCTCNLYVLPNIIISWNFMKLCTARRMKSTKSLPNLLKFLIVWIHRNKVHILGRQILTNNAKT